MILTLLPLLAVYGIVDYFREADLAQHVFHGLPLVLISVVETLRKRMASRLRIVRQASLLLLLVYTIVYLLVSYRVMISALTPRGLFLDPAVNVVLNHREELTAGAAPSSSASATGTGSR